MALQSSPLLRVGALVARRIAVLVLTVLCGALVSLALVRLAPGFGVDERQFDLRRSEASIDAVRSQPARGLWEDFEEYLAGLTRGDWGTSTSLQRPVRDLVSERTQLTLTTLVLGLGLAWILATSCALALEAFHRRSAEATATVAAGALLCVPAAIVSLAFLYAGWGPQFAVAAILAPRLFRYARNILAAASRGSHVMAARARGIGTARILWRYIWVPSAPELLALAGVSVSMAVGAVIPVEALSDSPGLGQLVWQSAMARDVPVLIHLTVLVALATSMGNLLSDLARTLTVRGA